MIGETGFLVPGSVGPLIGLSGKWVHVSVRSVIRSIAPESGETISYGIPTVTLDGRYVVYFAAWKSHMSVYPVPRGDEELDEEMAPYLAGKGTLRFAHDRPLPIGLIERVVRELVERRLEAR